MKEELTSVVQALAKGKSPSPNGLTAYFIKAYWSFMSVDFTTMVNTSLALGRFPTCVMRGIITLLFKNGDQLQLTNWRLIMLLNTTCKDFAKALQRHIQPLLMEVIGNDQIVFCRLDSF